MQKEHYNLVEQGRKRMNDMFVLYKEEPDGLITIPLKTYPTETIINLLKSDYGVPHPILMQQSAGDFFEITVLGHNQLTFRVYKR